MTALLLATMLFVGEREVQAEGPTPNGKPSLQLPAQVQAQPGMPFKILAETNVKWMRWTVPSGLIRVDPKDTAYGDKAFVGYGPAGVYEFIVEGSLNDVHVEGKCVCFVGQPSPGPTPPQPGPVPNDPLFQELQKLYSADTNPQKAMYRDTLASIYTTAADAAINDASVTTTGQLFAKLRSVSKMMLKDDQLLTVRNALKPVCKEMETDGPLDAVAKTKAAACFERCAVLVRGLK